MKRLLMFIAMLLSALGAAAEIQTNAGKTPQLMRVDIEASDADAHVLLDKLNDRGREQGLNFAQDNADFVYRITFKIGHGTQNTPMPGPPHSGTIIWNRNRTTNATCTVFDAKGEKLFTFTRGNGTTDGGVANSTAREIIKRLLAN